MKILGTGLDGLVGSRIIELLSGKHEFENLSLSTGADITDRNAILQKIKNSDAQIMLHLAAKTDVDGCELDKPLGEKGDAWKINVFGTQNVVDGCSESNKKIIYISTDFVFDGTKEAYSEEDAPNPVNWYGQTKFLGEMEVKKYSPTLFRALGIYLPLITTNCAIIGLALFQTSREYDFLQSLAFALGAGGGFILALMLMSGIRERLELSDVNSILQGAAIALMISGVLSMAFMGFAGMGR